MSSARGRLLAPASTSERLTELREQIDVLDGELVELICARLELAKQIGTLKRADGRPIRDREREREVIERAQARARERVPPGVLAGVLEQLITGSRLLQAPVSVAYLGPDTTHSHAAVRELLPAAQLLPLSSLREVVEAVGASAELALVPWWNRRAGPVIEVHEALRARGSTIAPLTWSTRRVSHVLAAREGTVIERVFARPEPLANARAWLERRLPEVAISLASSNDDAARRAAEHEGAAAITTIAAAERHGLERLAEDIDGRANETTFVILSSTI